MPPDSPLVAVVADEGAGKTTLLQRWHQDLVESADVEPIWLEGTAPDLDNPVKLTDRLDQLVASVSPRVFFVDDFHRMTDDASRSHLLDVAGHGRHRVVLASRRSPGVALGRWRVAGLVTEFGDPDLRLGPDTIEALAASRSLSLDPSVVSRISQLTEGWAEGVVALLDGLAADRSRSAIELVELLAIERAWSLAANLENVLAPEDFDVLVRTSILDCFDRHLAERVANSDGPVDLSGLLSHAPFTDSIDRVGETVRVRELARLGLWLRLREQEGPDGVAARHRHAGQRLVETGQYEDAISHFVDAGDINNAADVLAAAWARNPTEVTDEVITRLAVAGADQYVPHIVTMALGHLRAREFAEASWLQARLIGADWDRPLPHGYTSLESALQDLTGRLPDHNPEQLQNFVDVLRQHEIGTGGIRDLPSRYAASHYYYWLGLLDEARQGCQEVLLGHLSLGRQTTPHQMVTVLACDLLALIEHDHGNLAAAQTHLAHGDKLTETYDLRPISEISEAADHVRMLAHAVVGPHNPDDRLAALDKLATEGWSRNLQIHAGIELVRLLDAERRFDEAVLALEDLEHKAARSDLAPLHSTRLAHLQPSVRPNHHTNGPSMHLTTRERTLLYLLANKSLSQTGIADQLNLSINTVKSHLRSIYQKLGVTSRTELINEADNQGMLVTLQPWVQPTNNEPTNTSTTSEEPSSPNRSP